MSEQNEKRDGLLRILAYDGERHMEAFACLGLSIGPRPLPGGPAEAVSLAEQVGFPLITADEVMVTKLKGHSNVIPFLSETNFGWVPRSGHIFDSASPPGLVSPAGLFYGGYGFLGEQV